MINQSVAQRKDSSPFTCRLSAATQWSSDANARHQARTGRCPISGLHSAVRSQAYGEADASLEVLSVLCPRLFEQLLATQTRVVWIQSEENDFLADSAPSAHRGAALNSCAFHKSFKPRVEPHRRSPHKESASPRWNTESRKNVSVELVFIYFPSPTRSWQVSSASYRHWYPGSPQSLAFWKYLLPWGGQYPGILRFAMYRSQTNLCALQQ